MQDRQDKTGGNLDFEQQFLLVEYETLWKANWRSQQSAEAAVRLFLFVVGGLASAAAVLAAFANSSSQVVSTAAVQAVGAVAVLVAITGLPTGLYVANEQGYRVKNLKHLNDMREHMSMHMRLPYSSTRWLKFQPGPFSGRTPTYVVVEALTWFSMLLGVYLLANASGVAGALNGSGSLPLNLAGLPAVLLSFSLMALQSQATKSIAQMWEKRYLRDAHADHSANRGDMDTGNDSPE